MQATGRVIYMLPVYGAMMPLRLLEEIVFWKTQEMEHTVVIRELIPQLEPPYVQLMLDWQNVFVKTLEYAQAAMRAALAVPGYPLPPEWAAVLPRLINDSLFQSHEFIRQLQLLQEQSPAVRYLPVAPIVLAHIRRESEYFISVIEELERAGGFPWMRLSDVPDDSPEGYDGPEPADGAMRQDHSDDVESSEAYMGQLKFDQVPSDGMQPGQEYMQEESADKGRVLPGQIQTGLMHSFKVYPDPFYASQVQPGPVQSWQVQFVPADTWQPQSTQIQSGDLQSDYELSGDVHAEESQSSHAEAGRDSPGEVQSFEDEPNEDQPGSERPSDQPLRPEGTWSEPMGDLWSAPGSYGAVPIGGHKLPPLPYSYKALEPWIDEKTMRIHHDKHHQSYVDGLNKAEKKLEEARRTGDFELVKHWERELAFNGAGHYLHTIFWEVMSPKGGGQPTGGLLHEINRSFGSYNACKKQFTEAANKVEGGGWAIMVWCPRSHRLEILTAEKHQNWSQWDVVPLLPLDVWEHAYYLKHQNERPAYTRDWWNVVNWPHVAERFAKARTLQWVPYRSERPS
jgi:superoxide dismutase, Fe-Mn family